MANAEKTLDEKVAEALGYRVMRLGNRRMIVNIDKRQNHDVGGFFTQSIDRCKKYIEPELLKMGVGYITDCEMLTSGLWWTVEGSRNGVLYFTGHEETEEIAYCNALLDLKERERDESKNMPV